MSCSNNSPDAQCCGGHTAGHCDSSAFSDSCSDQGQGYPLSVRVGCPSQMGSFDGSTGAGGGGGYSGYVAIQGVVGVWDGTQWLLDTNSSTTNSSATNSSSTASSSVPAGPCPVIVLNPENADIVAPGSTPMVCVTDIPTTGFQWQVNDEFGGWTNLTEGQSYGGVIFTNVTGATMTASSAGGINPPGIEVRCVISPPGCPVLTSTSAFITATGGG